MTKHIATPWGWSQTEREIAPGILKVTTASHGGIQLDATRSKEFRKKLPTAQLFCGGSTWFEEDCDWALIVVAFPQYFLPEQVAAAKKSLTHFSHSDNPDIQAYLQQMK